MKEKNVLTRFEYIKIPALRFIGVDAWRTGEEWRDMWRRKDEFLPLLESMKETLDSTIPYVCSFCHHDDGAVDVINRYLIGRFFKSALRALKDTTIAI